MAVHFAAYKIPFLACCLLICATRSCYPRPTYYYDQYISEKELSDIVMYNIHPDKPNFIRIGAYYGLNRDDVYCFKTY